jgi:hypothetical protein
VVILTGTEDDPLNPTISPDPELDPETQAKLRQMLRDGDEKGLVEYLTDEIVPDELWGGSDA